MQCDMCGKETSLLRTIVEGTEMNVCDSCSKYGKVLSRFKSRKELDEEKIRVEKYLEKRKFEKEHAPVEIVVSNYGQIIRHKREKMGLTQIEFARKLNEKESTIHKMESGSFRPSLELAKKIERQLNIKLIKIMEEIKVSTSRSESKELTIGDFIKIRKR